MTLEGPPAAVFFAMTYTHIYHHGMIVAMGVMRAALIA